MYKSDFLNINSGELRDYIEANNEKRYTIIDVRQPEEYDELHIPGSALIPLPELSSGRSPLPESGDIVFICHSGARSRAAAVFAETDLKTDRKIYNLLGGISGWHGKTLQGTPQVQLLGRLDDFDEVVLSAMDLEKGAFNYYKSILEKFPDEPFRNAMEYLSLAEADHAEALYGIIESRRDGQERTPLPGFDDLFYGMKGEILEGGMTLETAIEYLESIDEARGLRILELSLNIEYSAFDLYKNAAVMAHDFDIKRILSGIANGEKNHMKKLAEAFTLLR